MRLGICGGTFDPIHFGHLLLAETAREFFALDSVVFVPAGVPPHKRGRTVTSGETRFEMLRRAVADNPFFEICRFEIDSDEISYTVRTLEYLHASRPNDELFLIVGSETLADIPNWFAPRQVCRLASPLVAARPAAPPPDFSPFEELVSASRLKAFRRQVVPMPPFDVSSTEIRERVAEDRSVRYLVPDAVAEFIKEKRLYRKNGS